MRYILLFLGLYMFSSCGSSKKVTKTTGPTPLDAEYYQNIDGNINRLHQLFQGTFVAYDENEGQWTVSDGDSVILYTQKLGEIAKDGHWIYNYDFMTSLPNEPIYTSIKKIEQIDRDSFAIIYYKSDKNYTMEEMLAEESFTGKKFNLDQLIKRDKKVVFVKYSASMFVGHSNTYEDKQCDCLRQNIYEITPKHYKVSAKFFDKETKKPIEKESRPNYLLRRDIDRKSLKVMTTGGKVSKKKNG
ncbi:MAG: hypothetical protein GY810_17975 [Aureispira sp.]|nr:hypothetical protein [Aureispira sp.]